MKKLAVVLLSALALTTLFACGGSGSTSSSVENKNYGKGKEMSLAFETNPSTGYDWQYEFKDGDAELVFEREDIKQKDEAGTVGGPMIRTYFFRANKAGNTTLVFTYKRPWEGGETEYDVVYDLSVDENLVITCKDKKKGEIKTDKELDFFPNPVFTE